MLTMDYVYYIVVLLILTGIYILAVDVKVYKKVEMKKETRFSRFLGMMNVTMGVLLFAVDWAIENWFW